MTLPSRRLARVIVAVALAVQIAGSSGLADQGRGQTPESSIAGRVVDGSTGGSIEGAEVTLDSVNQKTQTRADGTFRLVLPATMRRVTLSATKPGYITGRPGRLGPMDSFPGTRVFEINAGDHVENVEIRLWAEAAISGRVTDEGDTPIAGIQILVLKRTYTGAGWRWLTSSVGTRTDDQGLYRIGRLAPADYIVGARRPAPPPAGTKFVRGEITAEPPVYFPDAHSASAALVMTLGAGDQRSADMRFGAPAKTGSLSGQITGSDRSTAGMKIHVTPLAAVDNMTPYDEITTTVADDGRFHVTRLPEGPYRISTFQFAPSDEPLFTIGGDFFRTVLSTGVAGRVNVTPLPAAPTWVADGVVTIEDGRDTTVTLPVHPGARVRGRVVFDGATTISAEKLRTIAVAVRPADGGMWTSFNAIPDSLPVGPMESDGRFTSIGLPPGLYLVGVNAMTFSNDALRGWTAASLLAGGREMLGDAIRLDNTDINDVVLTLSDKTTQIVGVVQDAQGRPAPDARVIVFPKNAAARNQYFVELSTQRVKQTVPDRSALFTIAVVPGDYFVAAVTKVPQDWMTPEFLQTLVPRAVSATATLGGTARVSVVAR